MTTPSRRWFRFSLRTLFVVAAMICCWLGWNVNAVQNRKRLLRWADDHGVRVSKDPLVSCVPLVRTAKPNGPIFVDTEIVKRESQANGVGWFRQAILMDEPFASIEISGVWRNESEAREMDEAFPEATIIIGGDR